jgi:hypothetical protein
MRPEGSYTIEVWYDECAFFYEKKFTGGASGQNEIKG